MKNIKRVAVIGVAVLVTGSFLSFAFSEERYQDLQLFAKVLNYVEQYYVEPVDTHKLVYGAIKGMLAELDPHTNFLPPDIYKEFETETSGEFGGIGIEITLQSDVLTIISPIEDTPAWNAGVQAGDRITEINGESTKGLSLAEAAQKLHGKNGEKIRLGIYRDGFDKPKQFVITRAVVKVHSAKYTDLGDGYGYIRLTSFIENSAPEVEKAIKNQIKNSPNHEVKGVILDLRRNPGGLLDQAVKISDLFLEKGIIVSTIGRNPKDKEVIYAKKDGTYPNFPLIVLINEYSASASEIVAGALQDNKRALIMGQTSFGKGSVQSVVKLGDGSALKLTVARYYTPSGRSIQAEGIKPDVVIEDVDSEAYKKAVVKREVRKESDMQGHLLGTKEQEAAKDKDAKKDSNAGGPAMLRLPEEDSVNYWWKRDPTKEVMTPKEKLLSDDFQVLQAYNYLKAWRVMGHFGVGAQPDDESPAKSANAAAAEPQSSEAPSPALKPTPKPTATPKAAKPAK